MILKRMTATFGRLEHETLELTGGLNLIQLPNEGGKSTWSAFLRVMLYGLNTRERDKKGFLADKTRYAPWSGSPMEGELICTYQGRDIRIRRYTQSGVPMAACEITYVDSGDPVPGLNGDNLGDVMIGVSRAVYERSAFISQANLPVSQTPELEKRLADLVTSGEDGVSATQVRQTLTDWQRRRQYRTRGYIPELEARKEKDLAALEAVRDTTAQMLRARAEIDRLEEVQHQLNRQLDLHQAHAQNAQAEAYRRAEAELAEARRRLEQVRALQPEALAAEETVAQVQDLMQEVTALDRRLEQLSYQLEADRSALEQARGMAQSDPCFSGSAEEARTRAAQDAARYGELAARSAQCGRWARLWPVLGLAVAVAFAFVLYAITHIAAVAAVAVLALIAGLVVGYDLNRKSAQLTARGNEILGSYRAKTPEELPRLAETYCRRLDDVARAEDTLRQCELEADDARQRRADGWTQLLELTAPFAPDARTIPEIENALAEQRSVAEVIASAEQQAAAAEKLFNVVAHRGAGKSNSHLEQPSITLEQATSGLKEAQRRIGAHQAELSRAEGRRSTQGDPEQLEAELERIDRALKICHADYDALTIALEALTQADAQMRERFSPELNRLAGEYFARLTSGRYESVQLNREMEAGAEQPGSVMSHSVLALSQGTADQLWLAVRLAVCDLALPGEDRCPLVLDDALTNFDDGRARTALRMLLEMSEERQILLFTCHSREQRLLDELREEG